jgi:hypothetical protein
VSAIVLRDASILDARQADRESVMDDRMFRCLLNAAISALAISMCAGCVPSIAKDVNFVDPASGRVVKCEGGYLEWTTIHKGEIATLAARKDDLAMRAQEECIRWAAESGYHAK